MGKGEGVWVEKGNKDLAEWKKGATFALGKLAEWSIAAVLKTVELQGSGGSNPSLSASGRVTAGKRQILRVCRFCFSDRGPGGDSRMVG